jgi:hypothetical protein
MKILYVLKQDPEPTMQKIMDEHKKLGEVTVVDVRKEKDYAKIVDLIAASDKVISV